MVNSFSIRAVWFFLSAALYSPLAAAQGSAPRWLNLDYTFTDFTYKEPGVMSEHGRLAGVRGQAGLYLWSSFGLSLGGEYQDGHLDYDGSTFGGTPIRVVTNDYMRQMELLAHINLGALVVTSGIAERYWYNGLQISYRRRTRYNYIPIYVTYRTSGFYLRLEYDQWQKGWNKSHMSDVNSAANDVEFKLGDGSGMGAELGFYLPGLATTRVFVAYHKWTVKESDTQSDGTQFLMEPKNNTTQIKGGIGLQF